MRTRFYIPENLDIDLILRENPPDIRNFKKDKLLYILSLISEIPTRNKRVFKNQKKNNYFVPIKSTLLKQSGIYNYKEYLKYLIDNKIIESDNRYICGKKSRGYRFTRKYQHRVIGVERKTKGRMGRKNYIKGIKARKEYNYLSYWFDTGNLTIDYGVALNYSMEKLVKAKREYSRLELSTFNNRAVTCMDIHYGEFYFTVDGTSQRLYTNITNLPKELRKFITYDGSNLVGVDIVNAQPFLSLALFEPKFYSKSGDFNIFKLITIDPVNSKVSNAKRNLHIQATSSIMLLKTFGETERQQVIDYTLVVKSGQLYERYQTGYLVEYQEKISRIEAKEMMMKILNSKPNAFRKEKGVFKKMYPIVEKVFTEIKGKFHNSLAILLMRIESFLVIERTCKEIAKENPNLPIFTIHDNIVTTEGNEDYVAEVLKNVIKEYIGWEPTLRFEYWR